MDYTAWAQANLAHRYFMYKDKAVGAWYTSGTSKPLAVLVHGISGDYSGLVPLAIELEEHYQVMIIELPGHGTSGMISMNTAVAFQAWFMVVLEQITREFKKPALIAAHSFGCTAVIDENVLRSHKVILFNPVPTPSDTYKKYAYIIMRSAYFWAHIYNWRAFILLRGAVLLKINTKEAKSRVRWAGWQARPGYDQIVYQAGLVDIILDKDGYKSTEAGGVSLVVCGLEDTTAVQRDTVDMQAVFGDSSLIFLRGGHLLPIESPARAAEAIRQAVVN